MRLTRAVVTDDIGQWWVKDPLDAWMHGHKTVTSKESTTGESSYEVHTLSKWHRYLSGLECPHCVSFHAAWIVLGSYALSGLHPKARAVWRFGAAALSLSSIVGHASARLD